MRSTQGALRRGVSQRPPCRFEVIEVNANEAAAPRPQPRQGGDVAGSTGGGSGGGAEGGATPVTVVLDVAHNPPAIARFFDKVCGVTGRGLVDQQKCFLHVLEADPCT